MYIIWTRNSLQNLQPVFTVALSLPGRTDSIKSLSMASPIQNNHKDDHLSISLSNLSSLRVTAFPPHKFNILRKITLLSLRWEMNEFLKNCNEVLGFADC